MILRMPESLFSYFDASRGNTNLKATSTIDGGPALSYLIFAAHMSRITVACGKVVVYPRRL